LLIRQTIMSTKPTLYTARALDDPLTISYDAGLDVLTNGEIHMEHGFMRWGSNHTLLVEVAQDDTAFLAIYKPRSGERPLWDFPDGTLCQRETAAFVLSEWLGWHIVPPTVLREGPRGIGSVQVFINHDPQQHYFTFDESTTDKERVTGQVQRMAAFDAIANNADRKGGHCLLDETEYLWGIDHGLTFHPMNKLRTVIWEHAGKPLPDAIRTDLESLCQALTPAPDSASDDTDAGYRQKLQALLAESEMRALQTRLDTLLSAGCYPMPGPGPNRPWPAV
jgi:uncharacterized repeat protein (TIGR03843 family)